MKGGLNMKKIFLFVFFSVLAISLVLAAQGDSVVSKQQGDNSVATQGENGLQNSEKIRAGNYINSNGEQMHIQTENGTKLKVGDIEAESSLEINSEQVSAKIPLPEPMSRIDESSENLFLLK